MHTCPDMILVKRLADEVGDIVLNGLQKVFHRDFGSNYDDGHIGYVIGPQSAQGHGSRQAKTVNEIIESIL